jgi:RNA polymerase sigma factor (sigma-70 family)
MQVGNPVTELELDDEILVRRFQSGQTEFFGVLFSRHAHAIYSRCRRVVKDDFAAEDLTVDTFLTAFQNIDKYREENFIGWLATIARRLCLNWLTKAERRESESLTGIDSPDRNRATFEGRFAESHDVAAKLQRLPEPPARLPEDVLLRGLQLPRNRQQTRLL